MTKYIVLAGYAPMYSRTPWSFRVRPSKLGTRTRST